MYNSWKVVFFCHFLLNLVQVHGLDHTYNVILFTLACFQGRYLLCFQMTKLSALKSLKLCTIITSVELYLFTPVLISLTLFQRHADIGQVKLQTVFSCLIFLVSVIHRTLTWTTGALSLTCVHDSYVYVILIMCACTHGDLAHWQRGSTFSCAPDGVQTSGLWISSLMLYQLSHPITPLLCINSCRDRELQTLQHHPIVHKQLINWLL